MGSIVSRTLSVHKEHEVLLKLEAAGLDEELAQKLIESKDNYLATKVVRMIRGEAFNPWVSQELSVPDLFASLRADEEVWSRRKYPESYTLKGVTRQITILRELFPELKDATCDETNARRPPYGADGWFAIPRWEKIAPTYGEAVEKVLALIASKRKFYYRDGMLGAEYLRQHARTQMGFQKLCDQQKAYGKDCDILVVPAQFGLRHRGRSVRRAREVFTAHEFGLGAFAVGVMFLTHPERLQRYNDLWIDCAGDEYAPGADGNFSCAPFFYTTDGWAKLDAHGYNEGDDRFGSVSGFLTR